MAIKAKKSRKELLHEPDEFMVFSGRLVNFLRTYQQQVLYTVLGIFLILATVAVVRFVSSRNEEKASRMWAQIKTTYASALQSGAADAGAAGAEAALAAVDADFNQLIDKYGSKPSGRLARLNYAQLCLAAGKADVALPHFKACFEAFGDDPAWRGVALSGLAHALAHTGQHDQAAARFEELISGEGTVFKAEALFQLGWLYEETGESEKGRHAYERLLADYPDSTYADLVRDQVGQPKMDG
jgi:tetratricopeptide (TPR) repeat protein